MRRIPFTLLIFLTALPARADYPARVVGVSDGDTITVLTPEKMQVKVRLYGIDAPETGQDFGSRAKQAASELAFGKAVTVRPRDTDRYGRTVAEVILPDGRSLNREMVRQGMAWWYRRYAPADRDLSALETEARAAHRGLWGQPNPIPPWDWRRGEGV
jgi:endonuclease YncB( thermonuclease family)